MMTLVVIDGVAWRGDQSATPGECAARIAELEAAIRMTLRHADANGMQDWPVFRRLRKTLNK